MNFFIYSLPRSRTAWIANFLTYGKSYCYHEPSLGMFDLTELITLFRKRPITGSSDCANVLMIDRIQELFPDSKSIVIERPIEEVSYSLRELGITPKLEEMKEGLERVKAELNPLVLTNRLDEFECHELCKFTDSPWDYKRFLMLDSMNIQITENRQMDYINPENIEAARRLLWRG